MAHDMTELRTKQAMPLELKVRMTRERIRQWYDYFDGEVYVSFSGGKDSTVLLHLVREMYPDVKAVFNNTGLEYPEIVQFVKTFDNVEMLRPIYGGRGRRYGKSSTDIMTFKDVITIYGYPIIAKEVSAKVSEARSKPDGVSMKRFTRPKDQSFSFAKWSKLLKLPFKVNDTCCDVMKKDPSKLYEKQTGLVPYIATMTEESALRRTRWLEHGCNAYTNKRQISTPMAFWREQDVLRYIAENDIEIASVYGDIVYSDEDGFEYKATKETAQLGMPLKCQGCNRTGCVFCGFGAYRGCRAENKYQQLKKTHPKLYDFCMRGGMWVDNEKYDKARIGTEYWNPKQLWSPSSDGLGMAKLFDMINEEYGKDFIRYE